MSVLRHRLSCVGHDCVTVLPRCVPRAAIHCAFHSGLNLLCAFRRAAWHSGILIDKRLTSTLVGPVSWRNVAISLIDPAKGVLSVIAFHEKAGRSQVVGSSAAE